MLKFGSEVIWICYYYGKNNCKTHEKEFLKDFGIVDIDKTPWCDKHNMFDNCGIA